MKPASMIDQITAAGLDRAVPHFTVYVRSHNAKKCKYTGEFRTPQNSKCTCRKSLRTHYKNRLYRESAFTRSWEAAEAEGRRIVAELERRRAGGGLALVATQVTPVAVTRDLAAWITLFLETLTDQTQGVRDTYTRQLKGERSLLSFLDAEMGRASVPADLLQPNVMVKFKATLTDLDPATQSKFQQRVKKFLKYLNGNGALQYVPLLEPIKQDPNKESKLALEDAQYDELLAAIPTISNGRSQAVRALALLMRHTGLSIHDSANLPRSAFSQDEHGWIMSTNRQKTGKPVSIPVPGRIAEELLALPDANGFFFERRGLTAHATADAWGNDLGKVFKKVGLDWPKYGTHSLRHTFACAKLVDGCSYEQVGIWMGDAAEMVERTYSRMINKRWEASHAKARGGADFLAHN